MKYIRWGRGMLFLLAVALIIGLAASTFQDDIAKLGNDVEKRPGETGAENLFAAFGSTEWPGGSPWAQPVASGGTVAAGSETSTGTNTTRQLIGVFDGRSPALCSCNNTTCNSSMNLAVPGGTYAVYAVWNDDKFIGVWLELVGPGA